MIFKIVIFLMTFSKAGKHSHLQIFFNEVLFCISNIKSSHCLMFRFALWIPKTQTNCCLLLLAIHTYVRSNTFNPNKSTMNVQANKINPYNILLYIPYQTNDWLSSYIFLQSQFFISLLFFRFFFLSIINLIKVSLVVFKNSTDDQTILHFLFSRRGEKTTITADLTVSIHAYHPYSIYTFSVRFIYTAKGTN